MLASVEDAVSMSRKRADGLAELCQGIIGDSVIAYVPVLLHVSISK